MKDYCFIRCLSWHALFHEVLLEATAKETTPEPSITAPATNPKPAPVMSLMSFDHRKKKVISIPNAPSRTRILASTTATEVKKVLFIFVLSIVYLLHITGATQTGALKTLPKQHRFASGYKAFAHPTLLGSFSGPNTKCRTRRLPDFNFVEACNTKGRITNAPPRVTMLRLRSLP